MYKIQAKVDGIIEYKTESYSENDAYTIYIDWIERIKKIANQRHNSDGQTHFISAQVKDSSGEVRYYYDSAKWCDLLWNVYDFENPDLMNAVQVMKNNSSRYMQINKDEFLVSNKGFKLYIDINPDRISYIHYIGDITLLKDLEGELYHFKVEKGKSGHNYNRFVFKTSNNRQSFELLGMGPVGNYPKKHIKIFKKYMA